jgi:hypothetical protein
VNIVDRDAQQALASVILLLSPAEARELADAARDLADHPEKEHHHVPGSDFAAEITVIADTPQNRERLDPSFRALLDHGGEPTA